tara:strand:- start:3988 stop:4803 length:816 start_codon:yes stop_codon:yes gene_type:complete
MDNGTKETIERYFREEGFVDRSGVVDFNGLGKVNGHSIDGWGDKVLCESQQGYDGQRRFYEMVAERVDGKPLYDLLKTACYEGVLWSINQILSGNYVMSGGRILDIGCGSGLETVLFGEFVGNKGEVVGVDISPKMIQFAKERAKRRNAGNVDFVLADRDHLPFTDDSFDSAIAINSFSEGDNDCYGPGSDNVRGYILKERIEEWNRVLKDGGNLVVIEPSSPDRIEQDEGDLGWRLEKNGFDIVGAENYSFFVKRDNCAHANVLLKAKNR